MLLHYHWICPDLLVYAIAAVKEAAVQRKHNLYRDSMVMHNSDPNLHLLGEGAPIDWGEEYGNEPDADPSAEKRRRAKQVVSVIHDDEGALSFESGAERLMHQSSQEETESAELETCSAPGTPGSSDDVKEIREMLVTEVQMETPVPAGDEAKEHLTNGTIVQESGVAEGAAQKADCPAPLELTAHHDAGCQSPVSEEAQAPKAVPTAPASPVKPPSLGVALSPAEERAEANSCKPSDKETGEEVSTQACVENVEPAQMAPETSVGAPETSVGTTETSMGTTETSEGMQTEF